LVTYHSQQINGLAASTLYHYRVRSRDAAGTLSLSNDDVFTTATSMVPVPVQWSALMNVTVNGAVVQKTSGCDGCADAGSASQQQIIAGDGYAEFKASELNTLRVFGLSTGNPGTSIQEIKFGLRLQAGRVEVRESGVYRTDTTFATGDILRVAVTSGRVT